MIDVSNPHAERWTEWIGHFAGKPNLNFLEVGAYMGASSAWLLKNILTDPSSRILCVDTWQGGEDMDTFEGDEMLVRFLNTIDPWKNQCGCMRGKSQDVLTRLTPLEFDFAYIDGSHMAHNVLADSVLTWRLMKPDGIVIWDDYLLQREHSDVMPAVNAFLTCYQGQYELIGAGCQLCARKIGA